MKKGFTLIELLAVIVILAIIAVIAVPIVLNIINDAKESAILRSADFYLDGVETAIASSILKNIQISDGTYSIMKDGNVCIGTLSNNTCTGEILKIEVDGEKPSSGHIEIESGNIKDIELILSDKTIIKNEKGELVLGNTASVCKKITGDKETPGSLYECEVKPGTKYNFYVLSQEDDGTTNLIMDRNICEDGTLTDADKEDKCYVAYNESGDVSGVGPVTAMNYLNNATSTWSNISDLNLTYSAGDESFTNFKITGKARMPYHDETYAIGCIDAENFTCPSWMANYLQGEESDDGTKYQENIIDEIIGYWTLSYYFDAPNYAFSMRSIGTLYDAQVDNAREFGVRPVINVKL